MSHDGWRKFLPFYSELYKTGQVAYLEENVMAYYRTAPALACSSGGTTGNDKDHYQVEVAPQKLMEDAVFFAALLDSDEGVNVTVSIGDTQQAGEFTGVPAGGRGTPGVYTGSVPFGENEGDVVVSVLRAEKLIALATYGKQLLTTCEGKVQNWNAVAI